MSSSALTFELCCETPEAVLAAAPGGAHRIELCTQLAVGGLTPPPAMLAAAVRQTELPIHVLVRATAQSFAYSPEIFRTLASSIRLAKTSGAAGIVTGLLRADGRVDEEHTAELAALAHPLPVTFHRAFDTVPDQAEALEAVIRSGCRRVLTSGGAPDVSQGAEQLARLVAQAGQRIEIAAGGGLRVANARAVAATSRAAHYHGSLLLQEEGSAPTLEARVRAVIALLAEGLATPP